MNISGLLVHCVPNQNLSCVMELDALPGVEVFHQDEATGRIVVIEEAASVIDEVELFKSIKALPSVLSVEMVYHYFEDDHRDYEEITLEEDYAPTSSEQNITHIHKN